MFYVKYSLGQQLKWAKLTMALLIIIGSSACLVTKYILVGISYFKPPIQEAPNRKNLDASRLAVVFAQSIEAVC